MDQESEFHVSPLQIQHSPVSLWPSQGQHLYPQGHLPFPQGQPPPSLGQTPSPQSQPPILQAQLPQPEGQRLLPQGHPPPTQGLADPRLDPTYGYGDTAITIQPGSTMATPEPYTDVPDYLVLSTISLFFCWVCGIISIVKSANASHNRALGRYQTALMDALTAKQTAIFAILVGPLLMLSNFLFYLVIRQYLGLPILPQSG